MQFNEEFLQELEKNICELNTKDTFHNNENLGRLEKLLAIKTYVRNIEMLELQEKVLKQSETAFQNIDFDKLDFKSMLGQIMGK